MQVRENIDIIPGNVELTEIGKATKNLALKEQINLLKIIDVNPTPTRIHVLTMSASDYIIIPMLPDVAILEANKGIIRLLALNLHFILLMSRLDSF